MAKTGFHVHVKKILKQDNCYIIVEATMNNWVGLDTFIQKSVYLMSIFIPGYFSSFFRYKQAQIVSLKWDKMHLHSWIQQIVIVCSVASSRGIFKKRYAYITENDLYIYIYITLCHLVDTFIQNDLQMRTIEAIQINKRAMICKCIYYYYFILYKIFMINIIITFLLWGMTKMLCKNIHHLFKLDYGWLRNKMQVFVLKKLNKNTFSENDKPILIR